jgi:hypothetical protein
MPGHHPGLWFASPSRESRKIGNRHPGAWTGRGTQMEHFEATVRLFDIVEPDPVTARRVLEERLRVAGFTRWQVLNLVKEGALVTPPAGRPRRIPRPPQPAFLGARVLMIGVVIWSLWLLWLLAG